MTRRLTLADITDRQRDHLAVCIHEAAHSVAAVALGGVLRNAVVSGGKVTGPEGLTTLTPGGLPHGRGPEFAYAGPWAEAKFRNGGRRPTQAQMYDVLGWTGWKDNRELTAAGGVHLGHGVTPLLDKCWPAVVRVAQQLNRTGEVLHADVLAALGIDDGGGLGSAQLANLRAGLRSVPPLVRTTAKQAAPA